MHIVGRGAARLPLVATLVCICALPAVAQQTPPIAAPDNGRRSMAAFRIADGDVITLDGRLDEPMWAQATPAANFIQIDPQNGQPPTEQTEVRIVFNRDSLYMGVTCYDDEPDRWFGFQRRRDAVLGADDRFMWVIDTFLNGRTGYFFEMNPSGLMADALLGINDQNREWDGIWDARVRRSEIGWTLEIMIPFRTLNFNPDSDTWGINFQRSVRRKNEESIWTGWARNQGVRRVSSAGLLTGIRDVTQGHGLDIKPYGVVTSQASPGRGGSAAMHGDANAGVDLFYNPTPLLRANLTVNTDFAQTEVDVRQTNLTRFSLFFPERRAFFLDGAPFFDFASAISASRGVFFFNFLRGGGGRGFPGDERIVPFFSRRIGLKADGTSQKIDFGTKLTGQIGAQDVGFLHVRTGEEDGFAGEDFTVARVKRRLLAESYIGALYTRRDPQIGSGEASHTAGLDLGLTTSTFRGSDNLEMVAWVLHDARPDVSAGNTAFGGTIDYPNDLWNGRFKATEVQENFDPAVGFVRRRSYRHYTPEWQFSPRPRNHPYIRQVGWVGSVDLYTDLHNQLLTRDLNLTLLGLDFHRQDNIAVSVHRRDERLDAPFTISDNVTLPLGATYDFTRYRLLFQTANRRMLSLDARFEAGDFYSGTRFEQAYELVGRLRPGLILTLIAELNSVKLPEGDFTTRLFRINADTPFTPFVMLTNDIQYDSQSSVLGWQSRFRWILKPGNDLYVVYTHNWLDDTRFDRFATLDRRLASKVLYTYRF